MAVQLQVQQDSINLFTNSSSHFKTHGEKGIDHFEFGKPFMTSGVVLSDHVSQQLRFWRHAEAPHEFDFFELL